MIGYLAFSWFDSEASPLAMCRSAPTRPLGLVFSRLDGPKRIGYPLETPLAHQAATRSRPGSNPVRKYMPVQSQLLALPVEHTGRRRPSLAANHQGQSRALFSA